MKFTLSIVLLLTVPTISFGQKTIEVPSSEKTKIFGSSLEKYKNREKKDSQNNQSNNDDVIQIKTDLVVNDVLITDQKGNIITNLSKDDFNISENGELQKIEVFSFGEINSSPRSIVLILDTGVTQLPYLKNSIQAAKILIDKLSPNDKMAIVTDDLKLLTGFSQDKVLLKKVLDSVEVKYEELSNGREFTNLLAVLNEMFLEKDNHRIIVSQGSGNGILNTKIEDEKLLKAYSSTFASVNMGMKEFVKKNIEFSDIEEAIEKSRTTIYSIIPGIRVLGLSKKEQYSRARKSFEQMYQSFHSLRGDNKILQKMPPDLLDLELKRQNFVQEAMFKVADLSGGYTSFLEKPEDAENIYDNIFNDFSNRYSIGYYPTNQEQRRERRTVKIEVKNHPEYKILYRESYLTSEH